MSHSLLVLLTMTGPNPIQWNTRGFRSNYQHLRLLLTDTNAVVTCLQEFIMLHPLPSPPRGFRCGQPGLEGLDHGRVCILVKDHICIVCLPLNTRVQTVAMRCHLDYLYTICIIHFPPNSPVILQHLVDLIQQLPQPFLLLGHFNAVLNENLPTHFHSIDMDDWLATIDMDSQSWSV